jgi:hypothetical protein
MAENTANNKPILITFGPTKCFCGCGGATAPKSSFQQGHDMKLVSLLLHAYRIGREVSLQTADTLRTVSAEEAAVIFGGAFPAKLRGRIATGRTPESYQLPVSEPVVDPNEPRSGRAKVGRWVVDGTFEEDEFYYTNKKGEIVYKAAGEFEEVTGS